MSGPVPSPRMKGMTGFSGTVSLPFADGNFSACGRSHVLVAHSALVLTNGGGLRLLPFAEAGRRKKRPFFGWSVAPASCMVRECAPWITGTWRAWGFCIGAGLRAAAQAVADDIRARAGAGGAPGRAARRELAHEMRAATSTCAWRRHIPPRTWGPGSRRSRWRNSTTIRAEAPSKFQILSCLFPRQIAEYLLRAEAAPADDTAPADDAVQRLVWEIGASYITQPEPAGLTEEQRRARADFVRASLNTLPPQPEPVRHLLEQAARYGDPDFNSPEKADVFLVLKDWYSPYRRVGMSILGRYLADRRADGDGAPRRGCRGGRPGRRAVCG